MSERSTEVDGYIAALPEKRAEVIEGLRALIHIWVEGAQEGMRYRMPAFSTGDVFCVIAAQKHHYALYVCKPALVEEFRDALDAVDCGKGCIRFKALDDLPRNALAALLRRAAADPGWAH